jgi:hypothetical protein
MLGRRRGRGVIGTLGVLLAGPAHGSPEGDAMIARARAAEAAQLRALSAAPVDLHTQGSIYDGKTTRTIDSFRRLQYHADGTISNSFQHGLVDGKPVSEAELRKTMGAPEPGKDRAEMLTYALAPLSSRDMEVTAVGPAPGGGYTLRCKLLVDAPVGAIVLVVDEKTGRKRTASIEVSSIKAKLADRLENVLTYADDGGPAEFHARFHFKMGWIERAADLTSRRVPRP